MIEDGEGLPDFLGIVGERLPYLCRYRHCRFLGAKPAKRARSTTKVSGLGGGPGGARMMLYAVTAGRGYLPGISGGLLSRSPKIDPSARVETANHQSRDIRPHRVRKRVLDGTGPPSEASPMSMICRKSKIRFRIAGSLVMVKYQILQPEFPYILFNNRRLKTISRIHFKNRQ